MFEKKDQEFDFIHIKFEILIKNAKVDISWHLVICLGFRGEVWTVNTNFHVIRIYKVFKVMVMELNEISKEVDVSRDSL